METTMKAAIETGKFVLRLALFILVPIAISEGANLTGTWQVIFTAILPIALPIIDKYVHEDPRIPAKGLVSF